MSLGRVDVIEGIFRVDGEEEGGGLGSGLVQKKKSR